MTTMQIFALASSLLAAFLVLAMLRKRSFRERHAVWWLLAAVVGVLMSIWPGIVDAIAKPMGIADPMNLVFFVTTIILFLVCVQFSSEITSLEARVRRLAEETAMQDERIRALETRLGELERGRRQL